MYDYGRLVFLDNQKTGSTYVSHFLKSCCTLEQIKSFKHRPVRNDYDENATYFSTVRNPVELYMSLFRYGRDERGITYRRLKRMNLLALYEDFPRWLEFALDERNADIFEEQYKQFAPLGIGLMSYRAMRITLRHPVTTLSRKPKPRVVPAKQTLLSRIGLKKPAKPKIIPQPQSYDFLIEIWQQRNIADYIFRQEDLNDSLRRLATEIVPEYFDQRAVNDFLTVSERVNASVSKADADIPADLLVRLKEKERFLIEQFYPEVGQ